ncbi:MAG: hypothetical protein KDA28_06900, partial [Phycisphaerales bacterium]|nr:hypothetical protein [Phycisphaerales bacterium]
MTANAFWPDDAGRFLPCLILGIVLDHLALMLPVHTIGQRLASPRVRERTVPLILISPVLAVALCFFGPTVHMVATTVVLHRLLVELDALIIEVAGARPERDHRRTSALRTAGTTRT